MRDEEYASLGFEDVETQFWAMVCADGDLLQIEFAAIVSEPAEAPLCPPRSVLISVDDNDSARGSGWRTARPGRTGSWASRPPTRRTWRMGRSPPRSTRTSTISATTALGRGDAEALRV